MCTTAYIHRLLKNKCSYYNYNYNILLHKYCIYNDSIWVTVAICYVWFILSFHMAHSGNMWTVYLNLCLFNFIWLTVAICEQCICCLNFCLDSQWQIYEQSLYMLLEFLSFWLHYPYGSPMQYVAMCVQCNSVINAHHQTYLLYYQESRFLWG